MYCITVSYGLVRGEAKKWQYWQPALYKITMYKRAPNAAKAIFYWKYVRHLGKARRSIRLAELDAIDLATEMKVPVLKGIRHGHKIKW